MSESLSSGEIEDVLSSIRRLVSEDLRPGARALPADGKPAGRIIPNKLILTPALRVVPETEGSGIEQVVASVGAAVGARNDDWESETGDEELRVTEPAGDWPDDEVIEADMVALDQAQAASEGADIVLLRAVETEPVAGWAQQDDAAHDAADEALADENIESLIEAPVEVAVETVVEAAVAAESAETDIEWADAAEARVMAELADTAEATAKPEPAQPADWTLAPAAEPGSETVAAAIGDDRVAYEEQVLRELVRDIIRDELQGGLGERITRNIRKLVRAEIARAIAVQSLD